MEIYEPYRYDEIVGDADIDDDYIRRHDFDSSHTFDDRSDERLFSIDHYNEAHKTKKHHDSQKGAADESTSSGAGGDTKPKPTPEHHTQQTKKAPHHILEAATSLFLDTTVTKFL